MSCLSSVSSRASKANVETAPTHVLDTNERGEKEGETEILRELPTPFLFVLSNRVEADRIN